MAEPVNAFFRKKWLVRGLVIAAAVAVLSLVPRLPHEQTFRIDLGDSASEVEAVTLRWAPAAEKSGDSRVASIEDWTGEVTFRYEKNKAPRVIQQETRLADGDYVVEIELSAEAGGAVSRKVVALGGGTTSIDVSTSVPLSAMEPAAIQDAAVPMKDGGT